MKLFAGLLRDDQEVADPLRASALSSRRVLTMTYLDGYPLTDVFAPVVDPELRSWVARKLHLIWRQVLELRGARRSASGRLPGHLPSAASASWISDRSPFPEPMRKANLKLARALLAGDDQAMARALVALGYLDQPQAAARR